MKSKRVLSLLAYISVILIACSLVLGFLSSEKVFNWNTSIKYWCDQIALYLGLIVTVTCAFMYAESRRKGAYMIVLIIAVILIIVFMFL